MVLRPSNAREVSAVLSYCAGRSLGVVPQSGNTGLVGGSTPTGEEIIVSLSEMNSILSFDEINGILTCEAGCVLEGVQSYLEGKGHLCPVDLGAKGSCMIGGNVSTNAGGQYYYRFGSLHANVLGMEVVLADGRVLDLTTKVRKDNTGYHLKHLFIGAEGTLGIITKVVLSCPTRPRAKEVLLLMCRDYDDVMHVLRRAKDLLGEILSAFEMVDGRAMNLLAQNQRLPLGPAREDAFYLLVETQGSHRAHDAQKTEIFLETLVAEERVADGVLARDLEQAQEIWDLREGCNPATAARGAVYKYDISLPIPAFHDFARDLRRDVPSGMEVFTWGHAIDGNLHANVVAPGRFEKDAEVGEVLDRMVYERVAEMEGSISAEHGIGRLKREHLGIVKDPDVLDLMRDLKSLLDPKGILNPGKVLPERRD